MGFPPDHQDSKRIKRQNCPTSQFLHRENGNVSARVADSVPIRFPSRLPVSCSSWKAGDPVPQTPLQLGCRPVGWPPPIRCVHSGLGCGNKQGKKVAAGCERGLSEKHRGRSVGSSQKMEECCTWGLEHRGWQLAGVRSGGFSVKTVGWRIWGPLLT